MTMSHALNNYKKLRVSIATKKSTIFLLLEIFDSHRSYFSTTFSLTFIFSKRINQGLWKIHKCLNFWSLQSSILNIICFWCVVFIKDKLNQFLFKSQPLQLNDSWFNCFWKSLNPFGDSWNHSFEIQSITFQNSSITRMPSIASKTQRRKGKELLEWRNSS